MRIRIILSSVIALGVASLVGVNFFTTNERIYEPRDKAANATPGLKGGDAYLREVRANVNTGEFNPSDVLEAHKKVQMTAAGKTSQLGINWESMGPIDVGGRTRAIIVDNQNPDRFITGGVSGGIFISDNRGSNWRSVEGLPNLIVSTIDQGPDGTIYVGTGSRFEGSAPMPGTGIYKSTDGENFEVLTATIPALYNFGQDWTYVNRLKVSPDDDDVVYAGTNAGMFITENGGESWRKVFGINCQISPFGVDDIEVLPSGRVLLGTRDGVYYSDNPSVECNWTKTSDFSGQSRIDLAYCKADPDYIYAVTISGGGFLDQIYKSTDGGMNWEINTPAPPSQNIDPSFEPFGFNGQGVYDLALEVFPNNCNNIMLGGVQLYRVAGSWSRVASTTAFKHSGFYVHADKHYFFFNPNIQDQLLIASDGGIGVTNNASAFQPQFSTLNRNYITTQFYDIDVSAFGHVAGGTQDNGTILLDPSLPSSAGKQAISLRGGDGFGTRFSKLGEIVFTTLYYNFISRMQLPNIQIDFFEMDGPEPLTSTDSFAGAGSAPFRSVIDLWETRSDTLSRDSVIFASDTVEQILASLSSSDVAFSGTLTPIQPDAKLIPGSIRFRNPSLNYTQRISDDGGNGVLFDQAGDSVGYFNYDTRQFQLRFPRTPSEQSDLFIYYAARYNPGDTLRLRSKTLGSIFNYPLQIPIELGDSIKVQDPIQSLFTSAYNSGVIITREALTSNDPTWIDLSTISSIQGVRVLEFSPDGNQLFAGTSNGRVFRISGLRNLFNDNANTPENVVNIDQIYNGSGSVEGLTVHPSDPDKMLAFVANYGVQNHVIELSGISSGSVQSRSVQGNLDDFPVYSGVYDMTDPDKVIIGTDFGMWSTSDITATDPVWSPENEKIGRVPVFRVIQQQLPESEADNTGVIYAGTHGRGIWKTGDFVSSVPEYQAFEKNESLNLRIYPNPVVDRATIEFDLGKSRDVNIQIYDIRGNLMRNFRNLKKEQGQNKLTVNLSDLPPGNYIARVASEGRFNTARFIVVR